MLHGGALTCGMGMANHFRPILEVMKHYSTLLWSCFGGAAPFGRFISPFLEGQFLLLRGGLMIYIF